MIAGMLVGNLGKDALSREVNGSQVVSFSVGSRRYEKGGEVTDWVDVSFWSDRALKLLPHLVKGTRVAVRGSIYMREYEHQGTKRQTLTMRADDVELLGSKAQGGADAYSSF